jgi:hypothetical protein
VSTASRNQVMSVILGIIQSMTFGSAINGATTWITTSNRLRLWGDVASDQQPAAFLVTHREIDEYRGLGLYRRRLELLVYCYCRADSEPGGPLLDTMMESFEAAFNVPDDPSTNSNTLGGLVYWVRIEGRTFKDPGDIDNQTLLIVPIVVEMP